MRQQKSWQSVLLFARFALAAAFLSAVADRLGLWGKMGDTGVSWGDMEHFYRHTAKLAPWLPASLVPAVAWLVDLLEAALGICLLLGIQLRRSAWLSAALLLLFAISMAAFQSVKLSLNFSVLTCSACAYLVYLASVAQADVQPG
ncbi:MauE/DoxX family redox-associated membrane protein [Chitinimonas sp.]|uniref:MauE/DoxX family redox-associated membrane protein n=1 Tax=Chitinimonas sp. TaxID=1934313 RepID=UPI0035ADEFDB